MLSFTRVTNPVCRRIQPLLSPFLDGELNAEMARRVTDHLAQCDTCIDEMHALQQVAAIMRRSARVSCPDSVWMDLSARIAAAPPPLVQPARRAGTTPMWSFAAVVAIGMTVLSPTPRSRRDSADINPVVLEAMRTPPSATIAPSTKLLVSDSVDARADAIPKRSTIADRASAPRAAAPAVEAALTGRAAKVASEAISVSAPPTHPAVAVRVGARQPQGPRPTFVRLDQPTRGRLHVVARVLVASVPAPILLTRPKEDAASFIPAAVLAPAKALTPATDAATDTAVPPHDQGVDGMIMVAENARRDSADLTETGKDLWGVALLANSDSDPGPDLSSDAPAAMTSDASGA